MQRARFWILCAMGALLVISGALLFGARHWTDSAKALKNILPADVDMRLDNLVLSQAGKDDRTMVLIAARAHYYKTQDVFVLEDIRATIMTDGGDYVVEANRGRYEQALQNMTLEGDITVFDTNFGVLTSQSLRFKYDDGLLISDGPFCYSTPEMDLDGQSFVFHTREKRLTADGRTHMLLN